MNWWWITGSRATSRSRRRCRISSCIGPNGFHAPLKVGKVAAGHYRGRVSIGQNQGLFRMRPLAESRAFPEVGFYRQEDEMQEYGNNDQLLRQIAASTGGRYNPTPGRCLRSGGPQHRDDMELWPGLLALALLLNLVELVLRKWKGLLEALHLAAGGGVVQSTGRGPRSAGRQLPVDDEVVELPHGSRKSLSR